MTIKVLARARQDLRSAFNHIHSANPKAAGALIISVQKAFDRIELNPKIGRLSKEADSREWSVSGWPYVIVYREAGIDIHVLRVWHTRRDRTRGN